jgi:hypothetical protein
MQTWDSFVKTLPPALASHGLAVWFFFVGLSAALFAAVMFAAMLYMEPRMGRARFYADRLELDKFVMIIRLTGERYRIPWSELAGFADGSASHVSVVRKRPRFFERVRLSIPTPTPELRETVVNELVGRGLARV